VAPSTSPSLSTLAPAELVCQLSVASISRAAPSPILPLAVRKRSVSISEASGLGGLKERRSSEKRASRRMGSTTWVCCGGCCKRCAWPRRRSGAVRRKRDGSRVRFGALGSRCPALQSGEESNSRCGRHRYSRPKCCARRPGRSASSRTHAVRQRVLGEGQLSPPMSGLIATHGFGSSARLRVVRDSVVSLIDVLCSDAPSVCCA
jgi:hypothetical protein